MELWGPFTLYQSSRPCQVPSITTNGSVIRNSQTTSEMFHFRINCVYYLRSKVLLLSTKLVTSTFKIPCNAAISKMLRMEAYHCNQVPYHVHNAFNWISSIHRPFSLAFLFSVACFGPESRVSISRSSWRVDSFASFGRR
jgi:hypothetical protein